MRNSPSFHRRVHECFADKPKLLPFPVRDNRMMQIADEDAERWAQSAIHPGNFMTLKRLLLYPLYGRRDDTGVSMWQICHAMLR